MTYKNPTPVVVALYPVPVEDPSMMESPDYRTPIKLLAVRRAIEPMLGGLAFPGGYVDEGETAELAVVREMLEETGIGTELTHWKPVGTAITPTNRLLIFMRHIITVDHAHTLYSLRYGIPNREVSDFAFVDVHDTLCFPLHQSMLERKRLWA
jgi:ADP-ribose pyrophosphatase YjhB (NUDIX family)